MKVAIKLSTYLHGKDIVKKSDTTGNYYGIKLLNIFWHNHGEPCDRTDKCRSRPAFSPGQFRSEALHLHSLFYVTIEKVHDSQPYNKTKISYISRFLLKISLLFKRAHFAAINYCYFIFNFFDRFIKTRESVWLARKWNSAAAWRVELSELKSLFEIAVGCIRL